MPRLSWSKFQASIPKCSVMFRAVPADCRIGPSAHQLRRERALEKEDATVRASRVVMRPKTTITAHLIVGEKPEPFLAAVLEGIAGVCDCAVINDNSGSPRSENSATVAQSRLSQAGRLAFVRTKFTDFATARNDCIDATPPEFRHGWALFVDADEVHGDELAAMAALLPRLPENVSAVDGYSRHFVGSFRWWI